MSKAATGVYQHLLDHGNQDGLLASMQTRDELYEHLSYHSYERKLDDLFAQEDSQ